MDTLSSTKEARIYNGKKTTIFKDFYISHITYISQGRNQSLRLMITLASRPAELQTNCGNLHCLSFLTSPRLKLCPYNFLWLSSFQLMAIKFSAQPSIITPFSKNSKFFSKAHNSQIISLDFFFFLVCLFILTSHTLDI